MAKLYITVGMSGSGKTTWAREVCEKYNMVLIDTDDIRNELWNNPADQQHPEKVFALAYQRMNEALNADKDVVFCSTALTPRVRKDIIKEMNDASAHFKIAVYFDTPYEIAKERNNKRERVVEERVLEMQHKKLRRPTLQWPAFEPFDEVWIIDNENNTFNKEVRFE